MLSSVTRGHPDGQRHGARGLPVPATAQEHLQRLRDDAILLRPRRETRQARLRPPDVADAGRGEGAGRLPAEVGQAQLTGGSTHVLPAGTSILLHFLTSILNLSL